MDKAKNHALISDLVILAKADDKIVASEYDFILRIADRMKVSKEEVDQLIENPLPSLPLVSEIERITHFHKLILLMNVDWEAHDKEVEVLRNFGLKLGIRPAAIDRILVRTQQYENRVIPSEELIQIFQTYYN
ncbi:MAG: TerB family tellurite resistance protein [Bacteroidia bacterium]|nr:TerB family tellurite resistance protein [Bacteroidia bacterium]NNF30203.1 TerB family tellurite resistance protein [Flavobacteriaceae bacterium]MBT8275474.1 TerB family tellurite resistance protein [Bacteroidia bacterium]NNJ81217.1 TerB family tellurite resistance protein [Flavobacteriaceae bacterium]NNK54406.1 TerB family tellurite resistance protein [Flavobacteriaceae bacterium]